MTNPSEHRPDSHDSILVKCKRWTIAVAGKSGVVGLTIIVIAALWIFHERNGADGSSSPQYIAVMKWITHEALDDVERGFIDAFDVDDPMRRQYKILPSNSNGNMVAAQGECAALAKRKDVAVVVTISTPQTTAALNSEVPYDVVYAAVANPRGLPQPTSRSKYRTTGIPNVQRDLIRQQLLLIKTCQKGNPRIVTIYNSKEANSMFVQDLIADESKDLGLFPKQIAVNSTIEAQAAVSRSIGEADAFYFAFDNMMISTIDNLAMLIVERGRKPIYTGDLSSLKKGSLGAYGIDYYELGQKAYRLTKKALCDPKAEFSLENPMPEPQAHLRLDALKAVGISPDLEELAKTFKKISILP